MRLIAMIVTLIICYAMVDQGGWAYLLIAVPFFFGMLLVVQIMGLAK